MERYHRTIRVEVDRSRSTRCGPLRAVADPGRCAPLKLMALPLDEVLGDVVAGATLLARAKGVRLESSIEDGASVSVAVAEIRQSRSEPPGQRHQAHAARMARSSWKPPHPRPAEASVSVSDGCGGIPERDLGRVFDLAFRGDDARTPGDGRAGLGLAVTRGLVEAQRGKVSVGNIPGGCRFTIRLPLASGPDRSPSGTPLEQVL